MAKKFNFSDTTNEHYTYKDSKGDDHRARNMSLTPDEIIPGDMKRFDIDRNPYFAGKSSNVKFKTGNTVDVIQYETKDLRKAQTLIFDTNIKFTVENSKTYTNNSSLAKYICDQLFKLNGESLQLSSISETVVNNIINRICIISPFYKEISKNQIPLNELINITNTKEGCLVALALLKANLIAVRTPIASFLDDENGGLRINLEQKNAPLFIMFESVVMNSFGLKRSAYEDSSSKSASSKIPSLEGLFDKSIVKGENSKYQRISLANFVTYICSVTELASSILVNYPIDSDVLLDFANIAALNDILWQVEDAATLNYYDELRSYNDLEIVKIMRGTNAYWNVVNSYAKSTSLLTGNIIFRRIPKYILDDTLGVLTSLTNYARSIYIDASEFGISTFRVTSLNEDGKLVSDSNIIFEAPKYDNFVSAFNLFTYTGFKDKDKTAVTNAYKLSGADKDDFIDTDVKPVFYYGNMGPIKNDFLDILGMPYTDMLPKFLKWASESVFNRLATYDIKRAVLNDNSDFRISTKLNPLVNHILISNAQELKYVIADAAWYVRVKFSSYLTDSQIVSWGLRRTTDIAEFWVPVTSLTSSLLELTAVQEARIMNGQKVTLVNSNGQGTKGAPMGWMYYKEPKTVPFTVDGRSILTKIYNELPNNKINVTPLMRFCDTVKIDSAIPPLTVNSILRSSRYAIGDKKLNYLPYRVLSKFTPDLYDVLTYRIICFAFDIDPTLAGCADAHDIDCEDFIDSTNCLNLPEIGIAIDFNTNSGNDFKRYVLNELRQWCAEFIRTNRMKIRQYIFDYSEAFTASMISNQFLEMVMGIMATRAGMLVNEELRDAISESIKEKDVMIF